MLDAYADRKWANLQDTPLEFTITRENYSDGMTETVLENNELKNRHMLIDAPKEWQITDDKPTINDGKQPLTDDKPTIILAYLKEKGTCRTAELAAWLGLKSTQTKTYLYQLMKEGKIVAHGANKNRTYSLA